MGIQNYLKRVSKATKDIKSAIEEKGVSVAQCDGFETLANKVRAIQTGTSSDGSSLFTVLVFKSSQTKPATPTGGSFTTSAISYPSGWSDGSGLSKYVWMSYIVFKGDGSVYKNWVSPILVNGIINDDGDPIDLTDLATRTWVTDHIKNAIKNGIIDLSTYATKSYVDQKISEIPGGDGNFVESINGATGAITFAGSGVSKSGNTFTFNGGTVDPTTGVTSINDIKGDVTISEGNNITIVKSGKDLTISASAGTAGEPGKPGDPGKDGDTYVTVQLFTTGSSYETAPEVSNTTSTYDKTTRTVVNPPTGWGDDATKTPEKPYIWTIWGTFSENTGSQIGAWTTPKCLTGTPGPRGEDGDEIEEVFALSNESIVPTINSSETDSNNKKKTDDEFLPKFVFTNETKEAVSTRPSVSSTNRYLFGAKRRKHNGVWLDFSSAYLLANFVEAGLTEEEKEQIKIDVTTDITNELNQTENRIAAVENRVASIDYTKSTFINDPDNALISAITQYKDTNKKSFADLIVDGKASDIKSWAGQIVDEKAPTGNQLITKITDAGIDLNGAQGVVNEWATYKSKVNGNETELNSVRNTLNAQGARIEEVAQNTYTDAQLQEKITQHAGTVIDAKAAEINSTVAKSKWIWGVYNNTDNPTEILATKEYDITQFTDTVNTLGNIVKAPMTEEAYRKSIEGKDWEEDTQTPKRKWTRIAQSLAFSKIIQKTNSVTVAVNEGPSWASIVAKANESTGSELCLDADRINLTGTTNATKATIGNAIINAATITNGSITEAQINSCTITSKIQSKDYCNGTDPVTGEPKTKKGFLFDAASAESEFAIYAKSKPELTNPDVVISSTEIKLPAALISGKLDAAVITASYADIQGIVKATEINAGKISTGTLNVDRLNVGAVYQKMLEADLIAATKIKTVNPNNTGTVEIEKNYIVLTDKNNNTALNVTGDDFAAIAAPIQQELIFTGGAQQSAIDISNELNSVGYKELKFTGETNSVNFNNYNNLQIRLNSVKFNLTPNISCSPDEYDYTNIDGTYSINITLYVNNNRIASNNFTKYCYHVLNSGPQDWIFGNEVGAAEDSTIEFGSCLIPSVSSESVSIKFKIEVTANWGKSSSSNSINNFQINSKIYSASQKVVAQTVGSAKGVVIGANGFRAALDGENYAQFSTSSTGEMEFLIQAGGTSGYGINVKKDGIQMKLAGVWYAVTRGSDGNLQLN